MFKDITPLLADGGAFAAVVSAMADGSRAGRRGAGKIDKVVGIEARGFILAAPVACCSGPASSRSASRASCPAETLAESYQLEYGTATVEVHVDAFQPGDRVLIVDDVLATGGPRRRPPAWSAAAARRSSAVSVLLELGFLGGRARLPDVEVRSLLAV